MANPLVGSAVLPIGSRVGDRGRLEVGGCDVVELAREFGTPAYAYAVDDVRSRARAYLEAFGSRAADAEIVYASKAAPITALCALLAGEGLSIDVASGGELHTAFRAGFDPGRIHMHGNNKSETELRLAVEAGVGHLICDSLAEIERLDSICGEYGRTQRVLIRVTPGVKADTHTYIQTGQLDSKFGLGLADGLAARGVEAALAAAAPRAGRPARPHRFADLRARAVRQGDRGAGGPRRSGLVRARQRRWRPRDRLHA